MTPFCASVSSQILPNDWQHCTHVNKLDFSFGPEVPFDAGIAFYLAPSLARDATQFEARVRHRLCVGVHLRTGPMTLVHCWDRQTVNTQHSIRVAML